MSYLRCTYQTRVKWLSSIYSIFTCNGFIPCRPVPYCPKTSGKRPCQHLFLLPLISISFKTKQANIPKQTRVKAWARTATLSKQNPNKAQIQSLAGDSCSINLDNSLECTDHAARMLYTNILIFKASTQIK